MSIDQLAEIAQAMVAPGKGIIAIDESTATIKKRFDGVGIECTEENRRAYREMLLTTPKLGDYISGAILYDETLRQSTKAGVPFTKVMMDNGILPGIKVDKGAMPLAGFPGELVTEGLDGLRDRLKEYAKLGAKFAKWRAVITIGEDMPSGTCIEANCHALARYAALCQEAGIVPMVEPEVLMDGEHDIDTCYEITEVTLRSLFGALYEHNILLEGTILKASMVISGKDCPDQAPADEVAEDAHWFDKVWAPVGQALMQALQLPQCSVTGSVAGRARSTNTSPRKNIDPPSRLSTRVCLPRQPRPLRVANSASSTGALSVNTRWPSGPTACASRSASRCSRWRSTLW